MTGLVERSEIHQVANVSLGLLRWAVEMGVTVTLEEGH